MDGLNPERGVLHGCAARFQPLTDGEKLSDCIMGSLGIFRGVLAAPVGLFSITPLSTVGNRVKSAAKSIEERLHMPPESDAGQAGRSGSAESSVLHPAAIERGQQQRQVTQTPHACLTHE
jgi:hypothetical protein